MHFMLLCQSYIGEVWKIILRYFGCQPSDNLHFLNNLFWISSLDFIGTTLEWVGWSDSRHVLLGLSIHSNLEAWILSMYTFCSSCSTACSLCHSYFCLCKTHVFSLSPCTNGKGSKHHLSQSKASVECVHQIQEHKSLRKAFQGCLPSVQLLFSKTIHSDIIVSHSFNIIL